jgi:hypothetical protein
MAKRRKKPRSITIKTSGSKPQTALKADLENTAQEDPFDFGGLPSRDLKKNLGCG